MNAGDPNLPPPGPLPKEREKINDALLQAEKTSEPLSSVAELMAHLAELKTRHAAVVERLRAQNDPELGELLAALEMMLHLTGWQASVLPKNKALHRRVRVMVCAEGDSHTDAEEALKDAARQLWSSTHPPRFQNLHRYGYWLDVRVDRLMTGEIYQKALGKEKA